MSSLKDELLVTGYIREYCNNHELNIPGEVTRLFFTWFHFRVEILKWSTKYIATEDIVLSDNNLLVTKPGENYRPSYILADTEPVFDGIHCWRIKVNLKFLPCGISIFDSHYECILIMLNTDKAKGEELDRVLCQ